MPTIVHQGIGSDGVRYRVLEITSTLSSTDLSSSQQERISGLPMFALDNGQRLNRVQGTTDRFVSLDGNLTITLVE